MEKIIPLNEATAAALKRLGAEATTLDYPHMAKDIDAVLRNGCIPEHLSEWLGHPDWHLTLDLGSPRRQIIDVVKEIRALLSIE